MRLAAKLSAPDSPSAIKKDEEGQKLKLVE